jgi:hypothetical protein
VLTALARIVPSREVLTEPPTCWQVLIIAEATPASRPSTPSVAVQIGRGEHASHSDAEDEQTGKDIPRVARVGREAGE